MPEESIIKMLTENIGKNGGTFGLYIMLAVSMLINFLNKYKVNKREDDRIKLDNEKLETTISQNLLLNEHMSMLNGKADTLLKKSEGRMDDNTSKLIVKEVLSNTKKAFVLDALKCKDIKDDREEYIHRLVSSRAKRNKALLKEFRYRSITLDKCISEAYYFNVENIMIDVVCPETLQKFNDMIITIHMREEPNLFNVINTVTNNRE